MPEIAESSEHLLSIWNEITDLGLESYVAELDACGLTIIPPKLVAPPEFAVELRDTILKLSKTRTGVDADVLSGESHRNIAATSGQAGETWLWRILFEDPIFEAALMNRTTLALVTYLLGFSAKLSNSSAIIKGPVDFTGAPRPLGMHSDNRGVPAPFPPYAQVANVTWVLTDYSLENGCVGYLPGSHRLCRHPKPGEAHDDVVPVEAPAGSVLIWHGNTWHAPFPRSAPGLRVSMLNYFCRDYFTPQERYRDEVPEALLARNSARFATLMGLRDGYGWGSEGPDTELLRASQSGQNEWS